ncbi:MAG: hypothetical protein N2C12_13085, partial [Planctomycetales bacterium]
LGPDKYRNCTRQPPDGSAVWACHINSREQFDVSLRIQAVLPGRDGSRGFVHAVDYGPFARVDSRINQIQ